MKKKPQVKVVSKFEQMRPRIESLAFVAQKIKPQVRFNPAHFKTQHRG